MMGFIVACRYSDSTSAIFVALTETISPANARPLPIELLEVLWIRK